MGEHEDPERSGAESLVRLASEALSPRYAVRNLAAAAVLSCFASVLRQQLFEAAWAYALLLALVAFVPGFVAWLIVSTLMLGFKKIREGWRPEETVPLRARVVVGAALALTAWLGYENAQKYAVFPVYAKEGATRGTVSTIRSALNIYIGDHDGAIPRDLDALVPKYIERFPAAFTRPHGEVTGMRNIDSAAYEAARLPDSGGWAFVSSGPSSGTVIVDCVHSDTRGVPYISY